MKKILVSIVIPTLNSAKTISLALKSIKKQSFPKENIEIIVVDGGSKDETRTIAKSYGCLILENKRTQQEFAKYIGLIKSKGDCIIFLDSDEELINIDSILNKYELINKKNCKIIFAGGYKTDKSNYSLINNYINSFGDPFAYFMYGNITDEKDYLIGMKKKYDFINHKNSVEFFIKNKKSYPLIDLCAGTAINSKYLKLENKQILSSSSFIPKIPYIILSKENKFSILKNDQIIHHSADNIKTYLNKINWRIIVNIFYKNIPGTGFSNREEYQPKWFKIKKILFIPYAFSILLPLLVSLYLLIIKNKRSAILSPFITIYVAAKIVFYSAKKIINRQTNLHVYGQ